METNGNQHRILSTVFLAFVMNVLGIYCELISDENKYQCNRCNLTSMPTDIAHTVGQIILNYNDIPDIPLSTWAGHDAVYIVLMDFNNLTSFPDLSPIGQTLKTLWLSDNSINIIEQSYLEVLVVLEVLGLTGNRLTTIPDASLPFLNTLNLRANLFQDVPDLAKMSSTITTFSMAENVRLTQITTDKFLGFHSLKKLYLYGTNLTAVPDLRHVSGTLTLLSFTSTVSLYTAGITEMATLENLGNLETKGTNLSLLPSTCPVNPAAVRITAEEEQLQLCHCSMIWVKVRL